MVQPSDAASSRELAVDLSRVSKVYRGRVHALHGIDMRVRRGEVFGLLGPNGAGKSTLVKIMMTVIRPTAAHGHLLGSPLGDKGTLARVGYLPENHRFPKYLTGRQTLEFFGALSGLGRAERKRRAGSLLDIVGMMADAERKVSGYSKGMMQRVGVAQALMCDPDLVVLDEPTDGVDPVGRRDIREVLNGLRARGKTVFINSHLLSELELVCDRVAILIGGEIFQQGTIDELSGARQRYEIELHADPSTQLVDYVSRVLGVAFAPATATAQPPPAAGAPPFVLLRGALPDGTWIELDRVTLRVGLMDPVAMQPMIDRLRASQVILRRVQLVRPSLEELFISAVSERRATVAQAPGSARA